MAYFIESQASCSDPDTYDEGLDEAEWCEAFRAAEARLEQRRMDDAPASPRLPTPPLSQRVDREHPLAPLAAAAAAAEPIGDAIDYPEGLADAVGPDAQVTRVVFTINNPGEERPIFDDTKMAYMVYQLERGKNGTPHVQGYVRFKGRPRFAAVQAMLGGRAHVLRARGNEQQCRDYCTKEDTRIAAGEEHGLFDPEQGKKGRRSDLAAIAKKLIDGKSMKEIAMEHPADYFRYSNGLEKFAALVRPAPPRQREIRVTVYWGPPYTGKTHRVLMNEELHRSGGIFAAEPGPHPWDDYNGEKTILFDEFNWEMWDIYKMNKYLDKWHCPLQCRYHNKYAEWTRVMICANSSPLTWWEQARMEVLLALRRRLGHGCIHVLSRDQDLSQAVPEPDFEPTDGRQILQMHPVPRDQSTAFSNQRHVRPRDLSDAPAATAASGAPASHAQTLTARGAIPDFILCPDSQPPSPTQIQD